MDKVKQVGYSDIRLWPCYMAFTGTILFFGSRYSLTLSFILVAIPAVFIARFAAKRDKRSIFQILNSVDRHVAAKNTGLVKQKKQVTLKKTEIAPSAKQKEGEKSLHLDSRTARLVPRSWLF